jgi:hypothetical protein
MAETALAAPTEALAGLVERVTAYRQQALACAAALGKGPRRPRELKAIAPDAGRILLRNVYGWFERAERGVYRLTASGKQAILRWAADQDDERTPMLPADVAA